MSLPGGIRTRMVIVLVGIVAGVLLAAAASAIVWAHFDASRALWVAVSVLVVCEVPTRFQG